VESHAKLALQDFPEHFHDIRETFIKRRSKRSGMLHLLHLVLHFILRLLYLTARWACQLGVCSLAQAAATLMRLGCTGSRLGMTISSTPRLNFADIASGLAVSGKLKRL